MLTCDLVDADAIAQPLGLHRKTILAWVRDGRLPAPIRLSARTYRWRRDEVDRLLNRLLSDRASWK